jgi:signal peptidase I
VSVWIAVASLIVPGIGQALMSRRWRAIAWAAAGFVSVAALLVSVWMLVAVAVVRIAGTIDGIVVMRREQPGQRWNTRLAAVVGALFVATLVFENVCFDPMLVPSSSMMPTLAPDDQILVDVLTPRWRTPARGDVIVFRHPCQPQIDYVKRVVAIAGDTIEVRCDVVYVNGRAVPSERAAGPCSYDNVDDVTAQVTHRECVRAHETIDGHAYDVFLDPIAKKDFPVDHLLRTCAANPAVATLVPTPAANAGPCELQEHVVVPAGSVFVLGDNRATASDSRAWGPVPLDHVRGRVIGVWRPLARLGGS